LTGLKNLVTPRFRILLVEDFEPFRRFVALTVQARADFELVGEASDGLEALQKAKDLQPDLVVLDIGLPKMSGMEAAAHIRIVAPQAKLIFISLETCSFVVQEAFRLGAHGYIYKLRGLADLVPAIEAVRAGKYFVSRDIDVSDWMPAQPPVTPPLSVF
jgi:DNA-binding NarL/FixJ family response regulator